MVESTAMQMKRPDEYAEELRGKFKALEAEVRALVGIAKCTPDVFDQGEVIANAMLALRHCEDARMRLGKVIQYTPKENGGESCYAK